MKPESQHALLELYSFGVEELSSEQAKSLLDQVDECSECHGEWVLFSQTLTTLNRCGESCLSQEKSQDMWLMCVEHAKKKVLGSCDQHDQTTAFHISSSTSSHSTSHAESHEAKEFANPDNSEV